MPYSIRYEAGAPLATITYTGHLNGGEVAESFDVLGERIADPPAYLAVLCDTREATSLFALSQDVERTARALKRFEKRAPVGRGAYLGGRNHAVFIGLVRVLLRLVGTTRRERAVFTDHGEAIAWLMAPAQGG